MADNLDTLMPSQAKICRLIQDAVFAGQASGEAMLKADQVRHRIGYSKASWDRLRAGEKDDVPAFPEPLWNGVRDVWPARVVDEWLSKLEPSRSRPAPRGKK